MNSLAGQSLLVHGSIVLLCGCLSGLPFWIAIIRSREEAVIRAWRVAHTTLIACGMLMLVVGLIHPRLSLDEELRSALTMVLVASGYGFVFALVMGAVTGYRALTPRPGGINMLLFMGHLVGAVGAIIAISIVLYGLY